jgi:hypothetical protein
MSYKIVSRTVKTDIDYGIVDTENRYDSVSESGEIIDNAQGYGYKTYQSAQKAAWYKFKGGKQKTDALNKQAKAFWKNNKAFGIELSELLDLNFKAPMTEAEINAFALEKGISGFDIKFIDHLA